MLMLDKGVWGYTPLGKFWNPYILGQPLAAFILADWAFSPSFGKDYDNEVRTYWTAIVDVTFMPHDNLVIVRDQFIKDVMIKQCIK